MPHSADTPDTAPARSARGNALVALLLLVPAPTLGVLAALWVPGLKETTAGKAVFMFAKVWLLAFPLLWTLWVDRRRPAIPRPSMRGMGWAVGTGVAIFAVIAGAYYGYAQGQIDSDAMGAKMIKAGLDSQWKLAAMAVYWCTINSLLEEYVWRWFVFEKCKQVTPKQTLLPILASGLFFTVHHVLAMLAYLPGQLHLTLLASLGVFIGGATWSWLYLKSKNIYAAYVSHVFADIIIFWIAYQIAFGG
ncbi:MAG: CPBP family intramembrane glutamic endopeptidase [Phycisphaerales bacterium JB063]